MNIAISNEDARDAASSLEGQWLKPAARRLLAALEVALRAENERGPGSYAREVLATAMDDDDDESDDTTVNERLLMAATDIAIKAGRIRELEQELNEMGEDRDEYREKLKAMTESRDEWIDVYKVAGSNYAQELARMATLAIGRPPPEPMFIHGPWQEFEPMTHGRVFMTAASEIEQGDMVGIDGDGRLFAVNPKQLDDRVADLEQKGRISNELFDAALCDYSRELARAETWKAAAEALEPGDCPPMCASLIGCTDMGCKIADARELLEAARKLEQDDAE